MALSVKRRYNQGQSRCSLGENEKWELKKSWCRARKEWNKRMLMKGKKETKKTARVSRSTFSLVRIECNISGSARRASVIRHHTRAKACPQLSSLFILMICFCWCHFLILFNFMSKQTLFQTKTELNQSELKSK